MSVTVEVISQQEAFPPGAVLALDYLVGSCQPEDHVLDWELISRSSQLMACLAWGPTVKELLLASSLGRSSVNGVL